MVTEELVYKLIEQLTELYRVITDEYVALTVADIVTNIIETAAIVALVIHKKRGAQDGGGNDSNLNE